MLIALGLGILIGIFIVITGLSLTINVEPTGCIIFFSLLFFTFLCYIIIILKFVWVG